MAPRVKSGQSAKRALAQPGRSMAQRSLSFACEVDLREAAFAAIAIASDDRGSRITEIDLRCSTRRHARVEVYSRLSRAHANISTDSDFEASYDRISFCRAQKGSINQQLSIYAMCISGEVGSDQCRMPQRTH